MTDKRIPPDLSEAEAALERGDYGQTLAMLHPLANAHPLPDPSGAQIRLLMITAWMGQGDEASAIATCRLLSRCQQPEIRAQAKQLLTILESPSLERPERWSMRLPELNVSATGTGVVSGAARRRRSRRPPPPPPPPTGPTRGPALGFALMVTAVFIGLTVLLSGCVRIDGALQVTGPDRVMLRWHLHSDTGRLLPWQTRLAPMLASTTPAIPLEQRPAGTQIIGGDALPATTVARQLQELVEAAATAAGFPSPAVELTLNERNWLIGVRQTLTLHFDLTGVPEIPGLQIALQLPDAARVVTADPSPSRREQEAPSWVLHPGQDHHLQLSSWRWSSLGLGSVLIPLLLGLSLSLQAVRRQLGFGFPELPS
ncbi:MAG: DUF3153 domain-containing protein [Synechococcus sp.]